MALIGNTIFKSLVMVAAIGSAGCGAAFADSPYGKTFKGSAEVCIVQTGQCTGNVPIHVFLAKSGRLYSFLRSEGGQMFSLGQYIQVGQTQQRFIVSGSTLVFEDMMEQNGNRLVLRGYLRANGDRCSVTGNATFNGQAVATTASGSCEVSEGQN